MTNKTKEQKRLLDEAYETALAERRDPPMKIQESPVGSRFLDKDGDLWVRTEFGAMVYLQAPSRTEYTFRGSFPKAELAFGPFKRVEAP